MLLRTLARAAAYRWRHRTRHDTPLMLSFLVTARCTLRCKHCFYHREIDRDDREPELTFDEYRALSARMGDLVGSVFAGGEPFMRRDLAEIVRVLQADNDLLITGIATNGQLTASTVKQTETMCRRDPERLVNVAVSLDGFRDEHDAIRGPGAFDRALRTWTELKQLARLYDNLHLATTTVVNTVNQDSACEFVRWVGSELDPVAVNVMMVRQDPRGGSSMKSVAVSRYEAAVEAAIASVTRFPILRRVHPQAVFTRMMADCVRTTCATGRRCFHCFAGTHNALIDYCGNVTACEVLQENDPTGTIGNLRDHAMDFTALWNSAAADRMRSMVNSHEACQACTHETMGFLPSLFFAPNPLGFILGAPKVSRQMSTIAQSRPQRRAVQLERGAS